MWIIATLNKTHFYLIDKIRELVDTGISNFNTLKNSNIKIPMNQKLQQTSVLWCISKWNGILNKGGFIVVHLHSTSCSKQIHI